MKLFDIYNWAIGSKASFLNSFQNEEDFMPKLNSFGTVWKVMPSFSLAFS